MMAPGLPEIATKYDITNSSVVALTLSIFLLAYAIGVGIISPFAQPLLTYLTIAPSSWSFIRDVWTNLGEYLVTSLPVHFFSYYDYLPGPPHRHTFDHDFQSGLCICTNDRCLDRIPFPVYVNILRP